MAGRRTSPSARRGRSPLSPRRACWSRRRWQGGPRGRARRRHRAPRREAVERLAGARRRAALLAGQASRRPAWPRWRTRKLTRNGAIVGTPAYMAPEQARGDGKIDAGRADLYALRGHALRNDRGAASHMGPTPIAIRAPGGDAGASTRRGAGRRPGPGSTISVARLRDVSERAARVGRRGAAPPGSWPKRSADARQVNAASPGRRRRQPDDVEDAKVATVTSIVATHAPKGRRARLLTHLRSRATRRSSGRRDRRAPMRKALGDEASRALDLGLRIARLNATVGIATGRTRIDRAWPTGEVVAWRRRRARRGARSGPRGDEHRRVVRGGSAIRSGRRERGRDGTSRSAGVRGRAPFVDARRSSRRSPRSKCVDDKTPRRWTAPGIGKTRPW